jgi:rhodanese-related sulfurtransferase
MFNVQRITPQKAKKLIDKGGLLIDVRSPVQFRDGSLPNAINVSLRNVSSLFKHPKTTNFILFGESDDDENVKAAGNYLIQFGYSNVYNLGSKDNWS